MAQSPEAIDAEMTFYGIGQKEKPKYRAMKYGLKDPSAVFNIFKDDAQPGESLGGASSSSGPSGSVTTAVVEQSRKNRGNRHRNVTGMIPNQQIKKKIKGAKEQDDLDTTVLADDGFTVLSVSKYLGHADRYDCSKEYRQDMDFNNIPRDLYLKVPRVANVAGNGPYKRVHAEPDMRSPGAEEEFDTDEL